MKYEDAKKRFIKTINEMAGKFSMYVLFRDFITMASCTISNSVDVQQRGAREKLYLETAKKYDKDELNKFAEMIGLVSIGLTDRFGDFIGELYMHLEISNKQSGQFFTPYNVSKLMAQILDVDPEDKEDIVLNEPSVGSGGIIIAYAETMHKRKVNFQQRLKVICNDIDFDVVKMCYIQLSLVGIDAIVMQGDTITTKMNEVWITPMHVLNKARDTKRKYAEEADRKMNGMLKKLIEIEETQLKEEQEKEKVAAGQTDIFDFL